MSELEQVLPKVIWEEHVATPHGREWTRPLRMLAVAYTMRNEAKNDLLKVCV